MRPKIVSVKKLVPRQAPPPSEEEYFFLEAHGEVGSEPQKKKMVVEKAVSVSAQSVGGKKSFFEWLRRIFGK